ncbi:MAG: YtxH domain-containing protein [Sulfurimonas sp.]|nr:YtxH domain-containing protein [Sulfurimonas sp.]
MHNQNKYQNNNPQNGNGAMGQMGQNSNPYMQNAPAMQNPYFNQSAQPKSLYASYFGETPSDKFLRGLLIGGAAAYLLTNENAQKSIIKAGIKIYSALAGGVEEFKEKIMDVKAELEAEAEEKLD